ncbi:MAG: EAL domain-containing protein [Leptospiraceae bacterium]|nr:EAL domain-containing protein [Leptospiraceae bacterium]
MKSEHYNIFYIVLLLFSLGLLGFFFGGRSVDVTEHNYRMELFLDIKDHEAHLDQLTFAVFGFRLQDYDQIVSEVKALQRSWKELDQGIGRLQSVNEIDLQAFKEQYYHTLQRKLLLIEDIKSRSAVVRNGLLYLPRLIQELSLSYPSYQRQLQMVVHLIYQYQTFPTQAHHDELLQQLAALQNATRAGALGSQGKMLHLHLDAVLNGIDDLKRSQTEFEHLPARRQFELMHSSYVRYYTRRTERAEVISYVLLCIALALIFVVAHTGRLLFRAWRNERSALVKMQQALDQSPASIIITDRRGTIEYANPMFETTSGYSAVEVIGKNPRILKSGDTSDADYEEMWQTITSGKVWRGQFHNRRKDGTIYWEAASISPVLDSEGQIIQFVAVKEDITARKRAEDQLRMNAAVFDTVSEGITITDKDNRIKAVNPAFTLITGYSAEEVIGKDPSVLSSGRHDAEFYQNMWQQLYTSGSWSGEIWNRKKSGAVFPEWLSLSVIRDATGVIQEHVAVFLDITRRKDNEAQIQYQANYDALTGLPNRNLLDDRLEKAIAVANRENWLMALLFLDLDRFKAVNDTHGHVTGDELLAQVAHILQGSLRESDTVGRFGGDEFVIILEDLESTNQVVDVSNRIIHALSQPLAVEDKVFYIGCSIGICVYPDDGQNADQLMVHADLAMYKSKEAGGNCYQFFTNSMNESAHQRQRREIDLRSAIQNREFVVHYQPIVDLSSGRIVSNEALVRWNHPAEGLLNPAEFIQIAEDNSLIHQITYQVLEEACRQTVLWNQNRAEEERIGLSVNLSARHVKQGLHGDALSYILKESGLQPELLQLEITESSMLQDSMEIMEWIFGLKARGVMLAIDDFGTGFSALGYLQKFPLDTLKIDRSFIKDLDKPDQEASLVRAILALADSLQLKVIVEGVETAGQLAIVQDLGCRYIQGFYFSKAQSADAITLLLDQAFDTGRQIPDSKQPN